MNVLKVFKNQKVEIKFFTSFKIMEFFTKKKRGFTLIELLVVIGIIGILAGIVLVSMGGAKSKARDVKRKTDMSQVTKAQEMYYGDVDKFFQAANQDGVPAIGTYLSALNDSQAATNPYKWLSNTTCDQAFCTFAKLENQGDCTTTKYFAASEKGTKEICDTAPSNGCSCY